MKDLNKVLCTIGVLGLCFALAIPNRTDQLETEKAELIRYNNELGLRNQELRSELDRLTHENGILQILEQTRGASVAPQGSFEVALRDLYVLLNDLAHYTLIEYNSDANGVSVVILEHNGARYPITIGKEPLPPNKFTLLSGR